MCGIAGAFSTQKIDPSLIDGMVTKIKHRGPNCQNILGLFDDNVWLGHARLSIIDLSSEANQPMSYDEDKLSLTYNGEIYNYIELREELKRDGFVFHTNSDTEVILASYRK